MGLSKVVLLRLPKKYLSGSIAMVPSMTTAKVSRPSVPIMHTAKGLGDGASMVSNTKWKLTY